MRSIACTLALIGFGIPAMLEAGPLLLPQAAVVSGRATPPIVVSAAGAQSGRRSPRGTRPDPYPGPASPGTRSGRGRFDGPGFHAGYADGYDKGFDDADDRRRFEPTRHGRYRSANHGYEGRYGSKSAYRETYREGFLAGYEAGYRDFRARRGSRPRGGASGWGWFSF